LDRLVNLALTKAIPETKPNRNEIYTLFSRNLVESQKDDALIAASNERNILTATPTKLYSLELKTFCHLAYKTMINSDVVM